SVVSLISSIPISIVEKEGGKVDRKHASGPPHMKSFLTRVTVGEFSAEGEGNSKKLSKKRAALSILQELKKLPCCLGPAPEVGFGP
uniref:DRBM domain-containing protein n=1 Tax=Sinocyclocheilus rhinocerous TaxID=307959 RepID=A0A673GFK4_9TELE